MPSPYEGSGEPKDAEDQLGLFRSTSEINTLTVLGPDATADKLTEWFPMGVDGDRVRLLH